MYVDIVVPIAFFGSLFGILYIYFRTRNKERLALIEKGQSAELFNKERKPGDWILKLGIMCVGVAIGIVSGRYLAASGIIEKQVAYPATIFFFTGIGLIVSHMVERRQQK